MRSTWVSIERSRARVSASMPPPPPSSSRAAERRRHPLLRQRDALEQRPVVARRRAAARRGAAPSAPARRRCARAARCRPAAPSAAARICGQLDDARLGLRRARHALLHDLAQLVDLLGGLADHRQHVGGGQRLLRLDAGDAELGDRGEPLLELAVEAVLRVAGEELEQPHDQRAGEAEQRRAEGGAHAAELALEAAASGCRSTPPRSAPPAAPASGWCRPRPAPRWRGRRTCREGRGRSAG